MFELFIIYVLGFVITLLTLYWLYADCDVMYEEPFLVWVIAFAWPIGVPIMIITRTAAKIHVLLLKMFRKY